MFNGLRLVRGEDIWIPFRKKKKMGGRGKGEFKEMGSQGHGQEEPWVKDRRGQRQRGGQRDGGERKGRSS